VELTELLKDYFATELLSSTELDFLEWELWETTQYITKLNKGFKAPKNIYKKLEIDKNLIGNYFVQLYLTPQNH